MIFVFRRGELGRKIAAADIWNEHFLPVDVKGKTPRPIGQGEGAIRRQMNKTMTGRILRLIAQLREGELA